MDQAITCAAGATPSTMPPRAAEPRGWSILLTSANHGVVGPIGSQFPHAGEKHERVLVVEVPAAAGAPSDQVNLVLRAAVAAPVAAQAGQVAPAGRDVHQPLMIARIKRYRDVFGVSLAEAKEAVEHRRDLTPDESGFTAPAAGQVAVPGWISIEERLPDSGYCLATYRNRHGKLRIIRAKYARQFEIDADEDAIDQGNCEYNEADDTFYLKAGWLECIDNWDDYSSIYVTEGEVTHWMPLPAAPLLHDLTACANCLRPKCEHNGKLCPPPYTTIWNAWDYKDQEQPSYPEYAAPSPAKESK